MNCFLKICLLTILTMFMLTINLKAQTNEIEHKEEFVKIEKMPSFPGAEPKLFKYFNKNLKYPKEAKKQGIRGMVKVLFIIDSTGTIISDSVKVVESVHPLLDQEAIRLVKSFPKWTPAYSNGIAVKCYYILPIRFDF